MLYNLVQKYNDWLDHAGLLSVVKVFHQLEFRAFFAVVLSFLIVICLGRRTIRWLLKQKIGDAPEFYRADLNALMKSKAATPTMGGILICAAIFCTILLLADLYQTYVHLALLVLVWLAVLGGWDDWLKLTSARRAAGSREGLYAWEKLLFQLGVGILAGYFMFHAGADKIEAHVLNLPLQRTRNPELPGRPLADNLIVFGPVIFTLLATLLIAGTSNAVNLTDGMDGLAGGIMAIAAFAFMVLCYIAGSFKVAEGLLMPFVENSGEMMVVAGAVAGACLGFLWFNCAPAHVFMGDTGSLPLGGLLAYIAMVIRQEILLIVIGGVFFLEMASVMMQVAYFRFSGGKRIFRCSPIHHHFQLGGWSETQVVTRFWLMSVVLAMIALVSIKLR